MAEKLLGNGINSRRDFRDSEYWDTDKVVSRIKGKPKTTRIAKRQDNREWQREVKDYVLR